MANAIRAGAAFVELSLQDKFSKGLDKARKQLADFGSSLTSIGTKVGAIGAGILAPLAAASARFASMGDEINKASQRTGVGVEALTELKYAAEQSGASFEELESGLKKMQKTLFEAAGGSKEALTSLAAIGVTLDDLKGLSPDEQFVKIADALSGVSDASARTALTMGIFGKSSTQLIPLMAEGAAGIKALQDRARELGLTFGKEDAEAATKFGDTLEDLWKQAQAVTFQVGAAIANALQPFATATLKVMATVINWVKENRSLALSALALGVGLVAAGGAVVALGLSFKLAAVAISGIQSAFSLVAAGVGLLANPIVLVSALIIGLGGYLLYASGVGGAVVDFLSGKFNELYGTATAAFGGIADALAAGDIALAANILWAGLQLAWIQGTQELQAKWSEFKAGFVQTAGAAFYGALELYENVKASLMTSWEQTVAFFGDLWDGFVDTFATAWDGVLDSVAKGILYVQSLWDDSLNYDEAVAALDKASADRNQGRYAASGKNKQDRDAKRDGNISAIEQDKQKAIQDITNRELALAGAADANSKAEQAALEAKKKQLQEQLAALRKQASEEKKANGGGGIEKKDAFDPESIKQQLEDARRLAEQQAGKPGAKAAGVFNSLAVQSLQSTQSDQEAKRQTELQKKIEENTRARKKFS